MGTAQSPKFLFLWILGTAIGGCSSSDSNGVAAGGASASGGSATGGAMASTGGALSSGTGGAPSATGGALASGGSSSGQSSTGGALTSGGGPTSKGGASGTGGTPSNTGGSDKGGSDKGGSDKGGAGGASAGNGSKATGGSAGGGMTVKGGSGGGNNTGSCTASTAANSKASGSGPHKVTVETNSDAGIKEGTIFRPTDLGGAEKYPIFVWGEGGCSQNGLSNSGAMAELASHGYFVIADGTPNGSSSRAMDASNPAAMGKPLIAYIDWAIAENEKPCSAYYQSLDTSKIGANGFSCGGLMSEGTAGDPRLTTWGLNSSGLFGVNQAFYKTVHTPVLIVLGGEDDVAYPNGERDYDNISAMGIPTMLFSKALGHGGDLFSKNGGDFTKIDLAWLNWWLKGDESATGKGVLVGAGCTYCSDSAWEVKSKNLP